jgi:hypothetical protein
MAFERRLAADAGHHEALEARHAVSPVLHRHPLPPQ